MPQTTRWDQQGNCKFHLLAKAQDSNSKSMVYDGILSFKEFLYVPHSVRVCECDTCMPRAPGVVIGHISQAHRRPPLRLLMCIKFKIYTHGQNEHLKVWLKHFDQSSKYLKNSKDMVLPLSERILSIPWCWHNSRATNTNLECWTN